MVSSKFVFLSIDLVTVQILNSYWGTFVFNILARYLIQLEITEQYYEVHLAYSNLSNLYQIN